MTAAALPGIHNENEFFSHHYLSEIFAGDVRETVERWRAAAEEAGGGDAPGGPICSRSARSTPTARATTRWRCAPTRSSSSARGRRPRPSSARRGTT